MNIFKKIGLILVASLGMGTAAQAGIFSDLVERFA